MSTRELTQGTLQIPDFISSHPNHSSRAQRLDQLVPEVSKTGLKVTLGSQSITGDAN